MLRLVADENFNNDIVRGMLRRKPGLDMVRIQDLDLSGADDATVLEWCAVQERVLLTHDVTTITRHAYERVLAGKSMPGVFEVPPELPTQETGHSPVTHEDHLALLREALAVLRSFG